MEKPEQAQARKLYQDSGGKLLLKDIAAQLGVAEGTLRSWKKRHNWDGDVAALQTSATQREKGKQQKRKARANQRAAKEISGNDELNDADKDFCLQFIHAPNRVQAAWLTGRYKNRDSARQAAFNMMQKPAVQAEIKRLKALKAEMMLADIDDIVDYLQRAAFTDMQALADFNEYGVRLRSSSEVDSAIIAEVSETQNGVKIKRVDPLRAIELLCKIRGDFAPEKHQMQHTGDVTMRVEKMSDDELDRELNRLAARGEDVLSRVIAGEAETRCPQ